MKTKTLTLTHLNLSDLSERNLAIEEIVKFAGDYLAGLPSPKHTARFDLENNRKIGGITYLRSQNCLWEIEFNPF